LIDFTPEATATATWPSAGTVTDRRFAAFATEVENRRMARVRRLRRRTGNMVGDDKVAPATAHRGSP
jgi:hypothetical protein